LRRVRLALPVARHVHADFREVMALAGVRAPGGDLRRSRAVRGL